MELEREQEQARERGAQESRMTNLGADFEFPTCLLLKVSGPAVGQLMPLSALP